MRIAHPHRTLLLISSTTRHFFSIRSLSISTPSLLRRTSMNTDEPLLSEDPAISVDPATMNSEEPLPEISADSDIGKHLAAASAEESPATFPEVEDDEKFGFRRPEMYQTSLSGTVDAYDRHVFLCHKGAEDWAPRVESSDADPLPKLLASALKARKKDITVKTKLTVCEGGEGTQYSDGDVLVFPEMIKYRGVKDQDVDGFVEDVLVNGNPWKSGVQEMFTGSHVFVCTHGSRDRRCGVCGPVLMDKLKEEIELRGLNDKVFVNGCSHIGGHKYAGNLIVYNAAPDGNVTGHWYGYVTPEDVPELLDQHIAKGEIIERLWRGQMGAPAEEVETATDRKLPNGNHKTTKQSETESQPEKANLTGCCQGSNSGFTCCRDEGTEEKKAESCGKDGSLCKLTSWLRSFDQKDALTTGVVIGAAVTVAVVYNYYRKSR